MTIAGHAAVFNALSDELEGFREIIRPGAFANSIARDDIRALYQHNTEKLLGRNVSGTLRLSEDAIGLAMENDLPDTETGREVLTLIRRGDLSQMSFGFIALREDWRFDGGVVVRELIEAQLFDVSPVTYPAYPQTDVSARSRYADKIAALKAPRNNYRLKLFRRELDLRARL